MPCRDIFLPVPIFTASGRHCSTVRLSRPRTTIKLMLLTAAILLGPTPATFAACVPPVFDEEGEEIEEIESGGTVTCTGVDANGVETSESNVIVNVNAGALVSGSARGIELKASNYTINNAGTIVGLGTTGVGDGIHVKFNAATINNAGSISGNTQDGVNLGASPTTSTTLTYSVINQAGGTITGAEAAVRLNRPGTVDNHGGLSGDTGITFRKVFAGEIDNWHTIMGTRRGINLDRSQNVMVANHAGATISAGENGTGVLLGSNDDAEFTSSNLTFINNGLVDSDGGGVEVKSTDSAVTNTSQILAIRNGIGVSGANATLNNSGTITAGWNGFSISGANANLGNSGTVQGDQNGVKIDSVGATINNTGMITSPAMDGILFTGATSGATLNNSSMVMAARDGIRLDGSATGTMINNQAGGTISGGVVGIEILDSATNTTINNAAGAMITGISGGNGKETISNLGNISGDVLLAGGDDSFTLNESSGVFGGDVDGGDGNDTFDVVGISGLADFKLFSTVSNFETVQIEADATFDLGLNESVEVDGLFKTLGDFSGVIANSATVDLMGGSEFAYNTDFHIAADAELKLGGTTTFKNGANTFSGAGSVSATAITIDGGSVTNSTGGAFTIFPNLAATGGQFINEGTLRFIAGNITGGEIDGNTLTNGLKNQAGGHITFEAPARLEGVMENNGMVHVSDALTLSGGLVVNRDTLELGALGKIQVIAGDVGLLESLSGTLKKSGGFISDIGAAFTSEDGKIVVTNGTLRLQGDTVFKGNNTVELSAGTSLHLLNEANLATTTISGEGTLLLLENQLTITKLTNESRIDWTRGLVTGGPIFNRGSLILSGASNAHSYAAPTLDNEMGGTLTLNDGVTLNLLSNIAKVTNAKGATMVLGGPITGTQFEIANSGKLQFDRANKAVSLSTAKFDNPGTVEVLKNTSVDVDKVQQLFFPGGFNGGSLLAGTWVVHDGGSLTIKDIFGANTAIGFIAAPAKVELHGSGKLNNLPATSNAADTDIYLVEGTLELLDGANWQNGPVKLQNAVVVPPGSNHFGGILFIDAASKMDFEYIGVDAGSGIPIPGVTVDANAAAVVHGNLKVKGLASLPFNANTEIRVHGSLVGTGTVTAEVLVNAGPTTRPGTVLIENTGRMDGELTINGKLINNGRINPGFSPGVTTINGDFTQSATGILDIEVAGENGFDQLVVTGDATFETGSTINVHFLPGTSIASGTTLDFVQADAVSGSMEDIVLNIFGLTDSGAIAFHLDSQSAGFTTLADISAVPIPPALILFASALLSLAATGRVSRCGASG